MRCHVLKDMGDGRLKLLVFGDRNWKHRDHISRIRYVEADRVCLIAPDEDQTTHKTEVVSDGPL